MSTWERIKRDSAGGRLPGRNELPGLLLASYLGGLFGSDMDALGVAIEDAWTGCEWPSRVLELSEWLDLFDAVGFLDNGIRAERPDTVPVLYRAAVVGTVGMSWTDSLEQAEWFHARNVRFGFDAAILTLPNVAPVDVLAHFHDPTVSRGEREWVLDPNVHPDDVEIRPVT